MPYRPKWRVSAAIFLFSANVNNRLGVTGTSSRFQKGGATETIRVAAPISRSSPDHESRFQGDSVRQVVDVGRSSHYCVVNFGELLLRTIALDVNGVA
jgi:hypothetical protein